MPLISSVRMAISPEARSSSARARLGHSLRQRFAGLGEDVDRHRLQLLAHALAVGAHQHGYAGASEEDSGDQQQDTKYRHRSRPFSFAQPTNVPVGSDGSGVPQTVRTT
jgi:hypothetical protein